MITFYYQALEKCCCFRKKNYNTVPVIDNTRGDAAIADRFIDEYATHYNNVSFLAIQ